MTFSSLDSVQDGKYEGVGLVQISEIFVAQYDSFLWVNTIQQNVQ